MKSQKTRSRRLDDYLFCPNCLMEGKRVVMRPLWKFNENRNRVYLWFICPHKRKGEKGCGHKSIRIVKNFMDAMRKRYDKCEQIDMDRKRRSLRKRLRNAA